MLWELSFSVYTFAYKRTEETPLNSNGKANSKFKRSGILKRCEKLYFCLSKEIIMNQSVSQGEMVHPTNGSWVNSVTKNGEVSLDSS